MLRRYQATIILQSIWWKECTSHLKIKTWMTIAQLFLSSNLEMGSSRLMSMKKKEGCISHIIQSSKQKSKPPQKYVLCSAVASSPETNLRSMNYVFQRLICSQTWWAFIWGSDQISTCSWLILRIHFLQIYWKYEEEKDRFCSLWRTEEGIKAHRIRTILFGLNFSPFILNHILQLHLRQYEESAAVAALRKSLYIDNFLYILSQIDKLEEVYKECDRPEWRRIQPPYLGIKSPFPDRDHEIWR